MKQTPTADVASEICRLWPDYRPTSLLVLPDLARVAGVGRVFVKLEAERPLGNFKVLGGMIAGLRALARSAGVATIADLPESRASRDSLPRLICASDGNHGLAVAAAARRAGTKASIYLPVGVGRTRADRIEALDGEIVWVRGTYDDAVSEAAAAAARGEGLLIPDTSEDPDHPVVADVMAGYSLIAHEIGVQLAGVGAGRPTHLFVQAGVGGLAAAMAQGLRSAMNGPRRIVVVEPAAAACVAPALAAGRPVSIPGELHTAAEMLSCGLASAAAVRILRQHEAVSVIVSEGELQRAVPTLQETGGPGTTPSGAAGLAGLLHVSRDSALRVEHQLDGSSSVLLVISEGPVAAGDPSV